MKILVGGDLEMLVRELPINFAKCWYWFLLCFTLMNQRSFVNQKY